MNARRVLLEACLAICFATSGGIAEVGDVRAMFSPQPAVSQSFCAMGLAFDASFLYVNRCSDPNIYRIAPDNGALLETIPFDDPEGKYIPELPAAMAYDAKRNGLWIGTQAGQGGSTFDDCGSVGMPIYFWAFNGPGTQDDAVLLVYTVPRNLLNPATLQRMFLNCSLAGLAYRENEAA